MFSVDIIRKNQSRSIYLDKNINIAKYNFNPFVILHEAFKWYIHITNEIGLRFNILVALMVSYFQAHIQ